MFAIICIQSIDWVFISAITAVVSLVLSTISFVIITRRDAKLKKIELTPFLVIESMKLKRKIVVMKFMQKDIIMETMI